MTACPAEDGLWLQCVVSISTAGSSFFYMGVFVCVLVSECVRCRCCQPSRPPPPPPHPPLTSTTAASSTGRPVGGATHVLTLPWQPLSSLCPPHTHTVESLAHTHRPRDTHTHTQTYTLNSLDCIRCRTNLIHMPRQPSLKSPFMVRVSFK